MDLADNEGQIDRDVKSTVADAIVEKEDVVGVTPTAVEVEMVKDNVPQENVEVRAKPRMKKLFALVFMVLVVGLVFGMGKVVVVVRRRLCKARKDDVDCMEKGFTIDDVFVDAECPKKPSDIFADVV